MVSLFAKAESFKIAGEFLKFELRDGVLVARCEGQCFAIKKLSQFTKIDLNKARSKEKFIGSIGSDVCRLIYRSNSVIGVAANKDQRAFCVFEDGSLMEINSLSDYLKSKKMVTP